MFNKMAKLNRTQPFEEVAHYGYQSDHGILKVSI
jgi:hypothetical protein